MSEAPFILSKSDEAAIAEGCYFDQAKAERAIAWITNTFRVKLYEWQRDILLQYFGWRRADGTYRFTKIFVWIPKKNGKSFLISVLIAYKLFELRNARLFSAAVNANQAGIVLDQTIALLKASPKIQAMMEPRTGKVRAFSSPFRREIICEVTNTKFKSLADTPDAADGLIPDVQILDEIHRMKNRSVDVLDGNSANNPTCLKVIISTAGSGDKMHRAWQRYDYTKKVLSGEVIDTQLLPVVHECPTAAKLKGEEIYNLELLTACNPVLREDPAKLAQAARDVDEARLIRNDMHWRRFRLGQWVMEDGETYIDQLLYDECEVPPVDDETLAGVDCFVGLDKSGGAWDFTAITALFLLPDGTVYEKHFTFAGADRIEDMGERDDMTYPRFIDSGELITIPAEAVADEWLFDWCEKTFAGWKVKQIAADVYNASYLIERFKAEGFDVVAVQQSHNRLLSPVIEDYLERVRQGRIVHAANALYSWQLSCARSFTTAKDVKKIVKAGSNVRGTGGQGHIDNIDALINALAALRAAEIEQAAYGNSGGAVVG